MTTIAKHTPGPWVVTRRVGIVHGISAASDWTGRPETFATVAKAWSQTNAALIAAAPEMLDALKNLLDQSRCNRQEYYERSRGTWSKERVNMTSAAELIAAKAIAKAEGR